MTLHQMLGRDPWRAGEWTLDEAITIELTIDAWAREQRLTKARGR